MNFEQNQYFQDWFNFYISNNVKPPTNDVITTKNIWEKIGEAVQKWIPQIEIKAKNELYYCYAASWSNICNKICTNDIWLLTCQKCFSSWILSTDLENMKNWCNYIWIWTWETEYMILSWNYVFSGWIYTYNKKNIKWCKNINYQECKFNMWTWTFSVLEIPWNIFDYFNCNVKNAWKIIYDINKIVLNSVWKFIFWDYRGNYIDIRDIIIAKYSNMWTWFKMKWTEQFRNVLKEKIFEPLLYWIFKVVDIWIALFLIYYLYIKYIRKEE